MSILSSLFRQKQKPPQAVIEINNVFQFQRRGHTGNAAFRAAVDTIGRHAAKLQAHSNDSGLETLLNTAPNAYMSGYDLLYKTAAAYFTNNNAFLLLPVTTAGELRRFIRSPPQSVEFFPARTARYTLTACSRTADGFIPADIVHLRRHFLTNDLLGDGNAPLFPLLDTAETLTQGIAASVKNGTSIRGVLKFTSLVNQAQVKTEKEQFVADYFNPANSGGVAATDQRFDFVPQCNPVQHPARTD